MIDDTRLAVDLFVRTDASVFDYLCCLLIPTRCETLITCLSIVATAPGPKHSVCWNLIILKGDLNQNSRLI